MFTLFFCTECQLDVGGLWIVDHVVVLVCISLVVSSLCLKVKTLSCSMYEYLEGTTTSNKIYFKKSEKEDGRRNIFLK